MPDGGRQIASTAVLVYMERHYATTPHRSAVFPCRIDPDVVRQSEAMINDDRMQDEAFAANLWELAQSARY
jgi:hypothetical protein